MVIFDQTDFWTVAICSCRRLNESSVLQPAAGIGRAEALAGNTLPRLALFVALRGLRRVEFHEVRAWLCNWPRSNPVGGAA